MESMWSTPQSRPQNWTCKSVCRYGNFKSMKASACLAIVLPLAALTACTVNRTPVPTSGSRADGIVEMSYELGPLQQANVNLYEAQVQAAARCSSWGYTGAEAFGGQKRQCQMPDGYGGCNMWLVTLSYQCVNPQGQG